MKYLWNFNEIFKISILVRILRKFQEELSEESFYADKKFKIEKRIFNYAKVKIGRDFKFRFLRDITSNYFRLPSILVSNIAIMVFFSKLPP